MERPAKPVTIYTQLDTMDRQCNDCPAFEALGARVDGIEAKRDQVTEPQIDSNAEQIETLRHQVEKLHDEVIVLRDRLDTIGELAPDKASTPEQRMLDLRALMLNKARADYEGSGDGQLAWTYRKVQDALEENGHGTIYPHQAYRAMEDAADLPWYGHGENMDGEKVIRLNFEETPDSRSVIRNNNEKTASAIPTATMTD